MSTLTLRPNGVGTTTELTKNGAGGANWDRVDEASPDSDTTYVGVSIAAAEAVSKKDNYALPNHTTETGTINSVTVYAVGERISTGNIFAILSIYTHATAYQALNGYLTASYASYSGVWTTNPNTSTAWTWAEVDALEAGIRIYRAASGDAMEIRYTQVYVVVDYTISDPQLVTPTTLALVITTYTPTVTVIIYKVTPTTLALALTTYAPTVSTPRLVTPSTLALALTTYTPVITIGTLVTPTTLALAITTYAPTVSNPRLVTPSTLALVLATFAPTVLTPRLVTPTTLALVLTLYAPEAIIIKYWIPLTLMNRSLTLTLKPRTIGLKLNKRSLGLTLQRRK